MNEPEKEETAVIDPQSMLTKATEAAIKKNEQEIERLRVEVDEIKKLLRDMAGE